MPRKSKNEDNGQEVNEMLEETVRESSEYKPSVKLFPNQFDTAFSRQHNRQAIDYLALPGEDIKDLLMRAFFSSKHTDGHRQVRALARHIAKCELFKNDRAKKEALNVAAGDVSIDGLARNQLVEAIIGGNPKEMRGQMSFTDMIKKAAFGNNKKTFKIDGE